MPEKIQIYLKQKKVSIIYNNGSLEELFEKAEEEYIKIGELSFDEKYSLKGRVNVKLAAEKIRKANELNRQTKINETKSKQIE